jgi:hypothetical protein
MMLTKKSLPKRTAPHYPRSIALLTRVFIVACRSVLPAAAFRLIPSIGIFLHDPVLPFPFAAGGAAL